MIKKTKNNIVDIIIYKDILIKYSAGLPSFWKMKLTLEIVDNCYDLLSPLISNSNSSK